MDLDETKGAPLTVPITSTCWGFDSLIESLNELLYAL